jgi:hypothetical protein
MPSGAQQGFRNDLQRARSTASQTAGSKVSSSGPHPSGPSPSGSSCSPITTSVAEASGRSMTVPPCRRTSCCASRLGMPASFPTSATRCPLSSSSAAQSGVVVVIAPGSVQGERKME